MTDDLDTRFIHSHCNDTSLILVTITVNDGFINYFQKCAARWLGTAISKNQKSSALWGSRVGPRTLQRKNKGTPTNFPSSWLVAKTKETCYRVVHWLQHLERSKADLEDWPRRLCYKHQIPLTSLTLTLSIRKYSVYLWQIACNKSFQQFLKRESWHFDWSIIQEKYLRKDSLVTIEKLLTFIPYKRPSSPWTLHCEGSRVDHINFKLVKVTQNYIGTMNIHVNQYNT
jgi:hypothetical protein